jgi:hypothetical protein
MICTIPLFGSGSPVTPGDAGGRGGIPMTATVDTAYAGEH